MLIASSSRHILGQGHLSFSSGAAIREAFSHGCKRLHLVRFSLLE